MDNRQTNLEVLLNLGKINNICNNVNSLKNHNQNFCSFQNINKEQILIVADLEFNLEIHNLNTSILLYKIKVHDNNIESCHHFYDKINKKDLIITSSKDRTIKIFAYSPEIENPLENIFTLKNDKEQIEANSYTNAVMFEDCSENKNYLIVQNHNHTVSLFDSNGNLLNSITNCKLKDVWHHDKKHDHQIVTCFDGDVKLYDLVNGKVTRQFKSDAKVISSSVLNNLLIMSDDQSNIKTFDMEKGDLIHEVKSKSPVISICIWDIEYAFTCLANGDLECYEVKTLTLIKTIKTGFEKVIYAEHLNHPLYGPCLIVSGSFNSVQGGLIIITEQKKLEQDEADN